MFVVSRARCGGNLSHSNREGDSDGDLREEVEVTLRPEGREGVEQAQRWLGWGWGRRARPRARPRAAAGQKQAEAGDAIGGVNGGQGSRGLGDHPEEVAFHLEGAGK